MLQVQNLVQVQIQFQSKNKNKVQNHKLLNQAETKMRENKIYLKNIRVNMIKTKFVTYLVLI